uniref:Uncharacterized protein n=1 Tax=Panstrongylus lignarius TaxID=156445 RepID=A0A224XS69_9HEMI
MWILMIPVVVVDQRGRILAILMTFSNRAVHYSSHGHVTDVVRRSQLGRPMRNIEEIVLKWIQQIILGNAINVLMLIKTKRISSDI